MRRYGIVILGAAAAAVCIRLGFWQGSRLRQRMTPLDLARVTGAADSLGYRAATVRGTFDFARQIVVTNRVGDEVTAGYIVTPLRYAGGAVLVERGWTPSADGYRAPLEALGEPDTATVTGILIEEPRGAGPDSTGWPLHVRRDDPTTLAERLPYPAFPLVLRRTHPARALPNGLLRVAAPVLDNGPHLSYAIQWFSFAAIAIVGPLILLWNERRKRAY